MRNFERTFIVNSLSFALVAAGTIVACSTDNPGDTPAEDAGVVVAPGDEGGATGEAGALPDGALPDTSVPQPKCMKAADCPSGVCNQAIGVCIAASCKDGVKNAAETDLDCGGTDCAKCDTSRTCKLAADCISGVCLDAGTGKKCQAPTNTDMVKNGNETGVDCGGTGNPKCADGQGCATRDDCTSLYCLANVCTAPKPDDMIKDGLETDIDCGGPGAKPCADGKMCLVDTDCTSSVCLDLADGMGLRCQVPTYTDMRMNGVETDVDCGGDPAHPCATGKKCKAGTDCTSLGCDYNFKCANAPSCTAHYGGDTCGLGGEGGIGAAAWESCCTTIPVTTTVAGVPSTVYMDKYPLTAGRMRVFLESIGYDVRGFVKSVQDAGTMPKIPVTASTAATPVADGTNPVLDPAWNPYLPVSFSGNNDAAELSDCGQSGTCTNVNGECGPSKTCLAGTLQPGVYTSVRNHLGGFIFKNNSQSATGCYVGSPGTHSFRFPDGMQDGAPPDQPVEVYDTKTLNCVDYLMAQAFCVWDGGRLETFQEWQAAWGSGATPYVAQTSTKPAEPNQRCDQSTSCVFTTNAQSAIDCKTSTTGLSCNGAAGKCCLQGGPAANPTTIGGGNQTYFGCRFPWATDADHAFCGVTWPATTSIEYSDYKYSYEYPKLTNADFIVFLSAPGRTNGRGPLGHSDVIGTGFELTSSVTWKTSPLDAQHRWTGNGSWEVHNYARSYGGTSELINKYGKLGARCVKFAPAN